MSSVVQLSIDGGVASVVLNRPEARNAFNADVIAELTATFSTLSTRDDVRAILLRGNGPVFSAGADVEWMRAGLELSRDDNVVDARRMSAMFAAIERMPQPVIARVHGACLGGGMGLIAVCDCVVAADDSVFGFTETKLGLVPAVISTYALPKIGESWGRALFPTGERFGVELARQIGLVHWIARPEQLDGTIESKLQEIRTAAPLAARAAKRLVLDQREMSIEERRELTCQLIAATRTGIEGQEGLRAFVEKRPPPWHEPT